MLQPSHDLVRAAGTATRQGNLYFVGGVWPAAAALGEIADLRARDALAVRACDEDPDVRKTVKWALGRLGAA